VKIACAFIALTLSIYFYYLVKPLSEPRPNGDMQNFYYFVCRSPIKQGIPDYEDIRLNVWKKRIAGPIITGKIADSLVDSTGHLPPERFRCAFGAYHATWLFALFCALLAFKQPLLVIVGTFAGLMFYLSDPVPLFMPWDMPVMFFFTLSYLAYTRRNLWLLVGSCFAGATFKETALLPSMLLLFWSPWPMKKRLGAFMGFCASILIALNVAAFFMDTSGGTTFDFQMIPNLREFFTPSLRHVLFVNCGTMLLLFVLPSDWGTKALAVAFIAGQVWSGTFHEFRIWNEILPVCWIVVANRATV